MDATSFISQRVIRLHAPGLRANDPAEAPVTDRAARLPGYEPGALARRRVFQVGGGGLGGEIGHGLVRDGVGELLLCDPDTVELSNLNRQHFYAEDLYKRKAIQLARNLLKEAVQPITLVQLGGNTLQVLV